MKAVSGKFHPLFQWFYFDSIESLPPIEELTPEACAEQARWMQHMHILDPA
jgi:ubiquitin-activating enzyme E1